MKSNQSLNSSLCNSGQIATVSKIIRKVTRQLNRTYGAGNYTSKEFFDVFVLQNVAIEDAFTAGAIMGIFDCASTGSLKPSRWPKKTLFPELRFDIQFMQATTN